MGQSRDSDTRKVRVEISTGPFSDYLVSSGTISPQALSAAQAEAARSHARVGEALVNSGELAEDELYRRLAAFHQMRFSAAGDLLRLADHSLHGRIPKRFQEYNHVLPIALIGGEVAIVATTDANPEVAGLDRALGASRLEYHMVTPTDMMRLQIALRNADRVAADAGERSEEQPTQDLLRREDEHVLVELLDSILLHALAVRSTDLHIERYRGHVRLRVRVDGELRDIEHLKVSPRQCEGLVNIIKVNARLNIAEHRLPQGGQFSIAVSGLYYDLRVQVQPSLHGENVVIRILPRLPERRRLEDLGLPEQTASIFRRLIQSPTGLILVVGPTGCGKSTTLYAGLSLLAADGTRKVITIEDPVEVPVEQVHQVQVQTDLGFTFDQAMRSFVRLDPDVIMLGEVRDPPSALEAVRASQTGHVVLSTLHCNDAVDAVQRLYDLGVHPNSVASELIAVFAQRLARRICPHCREPHQPAADLLAEVFPFGVPEDMQFFHGKGCKACDGRGNSGRIAVLEYLATNRALRRAFGQQMSQDDLRELALAQGLRPLRIHALELVREGVIGLEEFPDMFSADQMGPPEAG